MHTCKHASMHTHWVGVHPSSKHMSMWCLQPNWQGPRGRSDCPCSLAAFFSVVEYTFLHWDHPQGAGGKQRNVYAMIAHFFLTGLFSTGANLQGAGGKMSVGSPGSYTATASVASLPGQSSTITISPGRNPQLLSTSPHVSQSHLGARHSFVSLCGVCVLGEGGGGYIFVCAWGSHPALAGFGPDPRGAGFMLHWSSL